MFDATMHTFYQEGSAERYTSDDSIGVRDHFVTKRNNSTENRLTSGLFW
jgi:hypothetical protein